MRQHKLIFSFLLFSLLSFLSFAERGSLEQGIQSNIRHDSLGDTIDIDSVIQDSLVSAIQAKAKSIDTLINKNDSDHQVLSYLDSLKAVYASQKGTGRATQWNDSVARAEDSLKHVKKSPLDAPVEFKANDSLVFYMGSKNAYLYGQSNVKYTNIELTAEEIRMNMDSSIVHAIGATDSLGKKFGEPIFKEGKDTYESETMSYNFKTKKGFITNVYTAQEDGFLTSEESKKGANDELYLRHGRYTTCDEEHPHFYIALSRAKVRTGKSVFSGPAWLVIEDVPLPFAIPYAFFPFTSSYSSGFIMPTYGDETNRGFYLRDGGYYFAINDNMDLKLTGEIYTKGSWGIGGQTTYKKRYKFGGNFYFNYQVTKEGEKNMPDYNVAKNFKVQWSHRQDPKASPNSSFSASVNFATQSYEKKNLSSLYNPASYSQSTRASSVSYSRSFPKAGLSLSSSMNITQNMRDSTIGLTLPNLDISLARFYPFKRKHAVGKERWYEKIAMSYTGQLSNSINTKEDKVLNSNFIKDWRNGMQHNIPISTSLNLFNYINVTPQLNYRERWYTYSVKESWVKTTDNRPDSVRRDTTYDFYRVWDYNMSVSANTTVYGFYKPLPIFGKKLEVIRHVITPSVSFSYSPDCGSKYQDEYFKYNDEGKAERVTYSKFQGSLYGIPGTGESKSINFDVSNNLEAKYKDKNDSIRKISIIDELGASLSYNLATKYQPWSDLSTRLRLKWGKTSFNINAVFKTYAYEFDQNGNVIVGNTTEWSHGRFGRFQGMSKNLSYTFNNQTLKELKKKVNKLLGKEEEEDDSKTSKDKKDNAEDEETNETNIDKEHSLDKGAKESPDGLDADGYMKFAMPWSFTISYGISMVENRSAEINVKTMRYPYKFTQNMNFSGNLKLSNNWNVSFSSGWDFNMKKLAMTSVHIDRDMHCFNISCGLTFGIFTSYNITMRAKASTLTDALKYDKKSSYSSNIKWY